MARLHRSWRLGPLQSMAFWAGLRRTAFARHPGHVGRFARHAPRRILHASWLLRDFVSIAFFALGQMDNSTGTTAH
eukprot:8677251-Alexandrium_andersonii.AAC.2